MRFEFIFNYHFLYLVISDQDVTHTEEAKVSRMANVEEHSGG